MNCFENGCFTFVSKVGTRPVAAWFFGELSAILNFSEASQVWSTKRVSSNLHLHAIEFGKWS